jgi:tRNA(Ile)-lysidine synthase
MIPGDHVGVAVSGGADSVALLRLLLEVKDELGVVLSVVHFNHHIRGDASDSDEAFVRELAGRYDLEFHHSGEDVPSYAAAERLSLEAAARHLRYHYLESLLRTGVLDRIATAHTLDDQAETVLLRLFRGAGTRGLAGIFPVVNVEPETPGPNRQIVRPLLQVRRSEVESYLREIGQLWRDDATNLDLHHARNRVRRTLLPLVEKEFTPAIRERLSHLAELARAEEEHWDKIVREILPDISSEAAGISIPKLRAHDLAVQRRLLRAAAELLGLSLEFEQVEEVLSLAASSARGEKQIMLGEHWCAVRSGDRLCFESGGRTATADTYEYLLPIPGRVIVPELRSTFEARIVSRADAPSCPDQMLSPRVAQPLTLRNWRPGDRLFPAHSKAARKLKELLQAKPIPHSTRHLWPVIQSGSEIIWVRGFSCPAHHLATERDDHVLVIREDPDPSDGAQ